MELTIQHEETNNKGAFFIEIENQRVAEMTYVWAGTDRVIIDHTEVSDALRGENAGRKLVEAAVNFAREKQIKIVPLCPFAKKVIEKTPEYHDIL
jgi:predicted GNAT family acetyltransferase